MVNVNLASEILSNVFLFLLMFGMSATVEFGNLLNQLRNRYAIVTGLAMQFFIMPALGFVAVKALGRFISPAIGITLLVVTTSPGGSYSNWWCSIFNADLALSVAMTALSTLLSTVLLPANLMLYSHVTYGGDRELLQSVDWKTLFITLSVVLLAIIVGLFASYRFRGSRRFHRWANRFGTLSGILLILFSATLSSSNEETRIWNQPWAFYVAVAFPCVVGLLLANILGSLARLKKPERVTVSVECCYQNVGIATSVAVAMFDNPIDRGDALCVPLFYGAVEAVMLAIYCLAAWKAGWTKAPRNERLCVILGTSYEVPPGEGDSSADDDLMGAAGADGDKDGGEDGSVHSTVRDDANTFGESGSFSEASLSIPGRVRLDTEEEVAHPSSVPGGGAARGGCGEDSSDEEDARMGMGMGGIAMAAQDPSVSVTRIHGENDLMR